jgi:hypothetical protein
MMVLRPSPSLGEDERREDASVEDTVSTVIDDDLGFENVEVAAFTTLRSFMLVSMVLVVDDIIFFFSSGCYLFSFLVFADLFKDDINDFEIITHKYPRRRERTTLRLSFIN